jgi:hypothetical protein
VCQDTNNHINLLPIALFALILLVPGSVSVFAQPDPSPAPQGNFKVLVSGTAPGSVSHDITLKSTQIPGGQLSQTTGFAINPESVVQVKQGENIIITTSENLEVKNVKAKNIQRQQVDLTPLPNGIWSLQNLIPGVYLLDVTVDMSSSGILGVYETVLGILQPDQTPLPPSNIISQLSILIETEFVFDENDNETDPTPEPPAPGNETEPIICTLEISYGQGPCDEYYIPPDENGQCPEDHRFVDDRTGCVPDDFVSPLCSIDAQGKEVCPPTDDPTPVPEPPPCPPEVQVNGVCPPTDYPTPVPEPTPPDCPEAGPEVCGEEPPAEEPPGSGDNGEDDNGEGDGSGDGNNNGGDGSDGDGNDGGDTNGGNGGTFDGGDSFFGN